MGKKTDYDLAVKIVDLMVDLKTLMDGIIDNLYTFRILEQPTDQNVAASGDTVTFTVKASGCKEYRWQYRPTYDSAWRDIFSAASGGLTDTLTFPSNATRANYDYSCRMVGYDDVMRRSNVVHFTIGS